MITSNKIELMRDIARIKVSSLCQFWFMRIVVYKNNVSPISTCAYVLYVDATVRIGSAVKVGLQLNFNWASVRTCNVAAATNAPWRIFVIPAHIRATRLPKVTHQRAKLGDTAEETRRISEYKSQLHWLHSSLVGMLVGFGIWKYAYKRECEWQELPIV